MSMHGDKVDIPARLREAGSERERELVATAERDVPDAAAQERALAAALGALHVPLAAQGRKGGAWHRRTRSLAFAAVASALLGAGGSEGYAFGRHLVLAEARRRPSGLNATSVTARA